MRSWLGSSLLSTVLLAAGCADPQVDRRAAFNPSANGGDNPGETPSGGQQMGNSNGTDPEADAGPGLDGAVASDGGNDAPDAANGGLCNVALEAPRGFHCTYINRIASAILAPPDSGLDQIKGCKDFPVDTSAADVTAACDKLVPALDGSIVVASGPCDTTGAVGYCSDAFGARDFAYHADCDITNMTTGSGSWACDKFVPNEAGWTCIGEDSKSWDRGCGVSAPDASTPDGDSGPTVSCDVLPTGDGKTYHCDYTNDFAGAPGCKQYTGSWSESAATADCKGLLQAKDGTAVFAAGPCAEEDSVGYCLNTRGDREYAYSGDCSSTAGSGKWACDNFGIVGQDASCASFVCASNEPSRRCTLPSPAEGKASCVSFAFGTKEADAKTKCDALGGASELGTCATDKAAGTCTADDKTVTVFATGYCGPLGRACAGTFQCIDGELEPIYSCRFRGCVAPGIPECTKGDVCVDYPGVLGFSEADARAKCNANDRDYYKKQANSIVFSTDPAKACVRATPTPTTRCKDDDDSLRYNVTSCSMSSIGDFFGAPKPENGPFPDYNAACATVPTYAGILSCRYTASPVSGVTVNTCIDFPTKDGWTNATVKTHCEAQTGVDRTTVVVAADDSCLKAIGGNGSATRCVATTTDAKTWYPYGVPQNVCTDTGSNGLSGKFEKGPFCADY